MRARSARPGVGFPVREIRGEAPSKFLIGFGFFWEEFEKIEVGVLPIRNLWGGFL